MTLQPGDDWVTVEMSPDRFAREALLREVPARDREAGEACWRVHWRHQEWLLALARTFSQAEWVAGGQVTDLHTGHTSPQLDLF